MIRSIKEVIKVLEVDTDALKSCESLDDEYYTIKLCFRRHVLLSHPDRPGGDPQRFREVYEAWDTIREFYESGRIQDSFVSKSSLKKRGASKASYTFVPSFAEFEDIIGQDLAIYRLEPARSGELFYHNCLYILIIYCDLCIYYINLINSSSSSSSSSFYCFYIINKSSY